MNACAIAPAGMIRIYPSAYTEEIRDKGYRDGKSTAPPMRLACRITQTIPNTSNKGVVSISGRLLANFASTGRATSRKPRSRSCRARPSRRKTGGFARTTAAANCFCATTSTASRAWALRACTSPGMRISEAGMIPALHFPWRRFRARAASPRIGGTGIFLRPGLDNPGNRCFYMQKHRPK